MHRTKHLALLFGMLMLGNDAAQSRTPRKITYDGYETMTWEQVPDDTKEMFKKNKLDVAGWLGWGCYRVKTIPDDHKSHEACVDEGFVAHPDFNNFKVTEPYIWHYR